MRNDLDRLLTADRLRELAGTLTFHRGAEYAARGAVRSLTRTREEVVAEVEGRETYDVELRAVDGDLVAGCTCPVGGGGAPCKHAVAAGLVALRGEALPPPARPRTPDPSLEDVRAWLAARPAGELATMLGDAAGEDETVRRRLILRMRASEPAGPAVGALEREIDRRTRPPEAFDRRASAVAARAVDDLVDEIERLLPAHAGAAVGLCERLLDGLAELLQRIDDSAGHITSLRDRTEALHLRACRVARPDPTALARLLHASHMGSEIEAFHGAVERYADVLGKEGVAEFRRLAEPAWSALPPRPTGGEGARSEPVEAWHHRFRVTSAMLALCRAEGDVDAYVRVLSHDLRSAADAMRVVQAYAAAGRAAEALESAERGLAEHPDDTVDGGLATFVAERHHERGRHEDAVAVRFAAFERKPDVPTFERVLASAERAGARTAWRDRAIAVVRARVEAAEATAAPSAAHARRARTEAASRDLWVRMLLTDERLDEAWTVAHAGPCDASTRLAVAERRARSHPLELAALLPQEVERALAERTPRGYARATDVLRRLRDLLAAGGRPTEFRTYLESVRAVHRAKRNFVAMLDRGL